MTQNFSNKYVELSQGVPIAKAEFTQLTSPATKLYHGQHGFQAEIWPIKTQLQKTHSEVSKDPRVFSEHQEAMALLPEATRVIIRSLEVRNLWVLFILVVAISMNGLTLYLVETENEKAISDKGSLPGIQLATAWPDYIGQRKFLAKDTAQVIQQARDTVRAMRQDEIDKVLDGFSVGASWAVDHGYRHIQIHAAHGYLPNLLIDRDINPNARYALDRFATIAQWLRSQSIETSIRCSMKTGDVGVDDRGIISGCEDVAALPFDFIDLSSGFYNVDKRLIYPSTQAVLNQRHNESLTVARRFSNKRFIVSGKIFREVKVLPSNVDIGICRDLIANPSFLLDQSEGCRNRGKCHYHSRGEKYVTCPRWAEIA